MTKERIRTARNNTPIELASTKLSRRQLFKGVAGGMGMAFVLSGTANASEGSVVAGLVDDAETDDLVRLDLADGSHVEVSLARDGVVRRDAPISLTELIKGEEVNAEGSWHGKRFVADLISPTYRSGEATVSEARSDGLETDQGWIAFNSYTQPHGGEDMEARPLSEIQPGDTVRVLGRVDVQEMEFVALRVGVLR